MKNLILAKRYARALLTIGQEDKKYKKYGEELDVFVGFLKENPEVENAISNPRYPVENRQNVLKIIVEKLGLSNAVQRFLALVLEKKRMPYIASICECYHSLVDDLENISRAKIISAVPLEEKALSSITNALEKIVGRKIIAETETDSDIIGGVIAKVGDLVFDGSVKTQLLNIKENLKRGE
ncbi:MAG TPA: ATP synthase F1 subunit delta [Deltaproteobacteria bacterium]|nr:ATP synthase F1 subunit delta [Deltaproteobacteria bacterium]